MSRASFLFGSGIEQGFIKIDGYIAKQCQQCKQWLDTPESAEGCRDNECPVLKQWYNPDN